MGRLAKPYLILGNTERISDISDILFIDRFGFAVIPFVDDGGIRIIIVSIVFHGLQDQLMKLFVIDPAVNAKFSDIFCAVCHFASFHVLNIQVLMKYFIARRAKSVFFIIKQLRFSKLSSF